MSYSHQIYDIMETLEHILDAVHRDDSLVEQHPAISGDAIERLCTAFNNLAAVADALSEVGQ